MADPSATAAFSRLVYIATDSSGALYVADEGD
jgi:hypothetical protein